MEAEMGAEPDSSIVAEARLGFWRKRPRRIGGSASGRGDARHRWGPSRHPKGHASQLGCVPRTARRGGGRRGRRRRGEEGASWGGGIARHEREDEGDTSRFGRQTSLRE